MCFRKSKVAQAFQSFRFLVDYGFSLKRYLRDSDEERVYTKGNVVVEVSYTLCMLPNGNDMGVDVIITTNGYRDNLLRYTKIFNEESLKVLKTHINAVTPLEQIPMYADFIKINIDTLLEYAK